MTEKGGSRVGIHVVGLHRVPFDRKQIELDLARNWPGAQTEGVECTEQVRKQVEENWRNAWMVVVEFDCPASAVDFGSFAHGPGTRPEDRQAAWEEKILEDSPHRTIGAFFLHYVNPQEPLWYETLTFTFPPPTPAPVKLLRGVHYTSPD